MASGPSHPLLSAPAPGRPHPTSFCSNYSAAASSLQAHEYSLLLLLTSFLFLCCYTQLLGQTTVVAGQVLDAGTRSVVSFATVGIPGRQVGTVADEQGRFQLLLPAALAPDTLLISCIGYQSSRIAAAKFLAGLHQVQLKPAPVNLGEVTIRPGNTNLTRIGRTRNATKLTTPGR